MKRALVLSGGGAKGCFQVGVMKHLLKEWMPDCVYGTSVGALNAFGLSFMGMEGTEKMWRSIQGRSDILSLKLNMLWSDSVYSMKPLREKLQAGLKVEALEYVGDACVVVTNLVDGSLNYYYRRQMSHDAFALMTEASACIPFFMEMPLGKYVDGGVREQAPLAQAIKDGADEIIIILCNPMVQNPLNKWKTSWPHFLSAGMRALDVMEHEVFVNDVRKCTRYNNEKGKKKINLKVFAPGRILMSTLDFDPKKIAAGIAHGEEKWVTYGQR